MKDDRTTGSGAEIIVIRIKGCIVYLNLAAFLLYDDPHGSVPDNQSVVRYPGENIERIRRENQEKGIPVKKSIWLEIIKL